MITIGHRIVIRRRHREAAPLTKRPGLSGGFTGNSITGNREKSVAGAIMIRRSDVPRWTAIMRVKVEVSLEL
jgi:hypothetical protein